MKILLREHPRIRLAFGWLVVLFSIAIIWGGGFFLMRSPLGDPLLRLSYDSLHLFLGHAKDQNVVIIGINEQTDQKLNRKKDESISRVKHAQLLNRLKQADVNRVCYDIVFDRPDQDPAVDSAFAEALRSQGHAILGATGIVTSSESGAALDQAVDAPTPPLRAAAEGWGLLNIPIADSDHVIRIFNFGDWQYPPLSGTAAAATKSSALAMPPKGAWMVYPLYPGDIPDFEFTDAMDPSIVPDNQLRGKIVFIGGEYRESPSGQRDWYPTPYSRFGWPEISGVALHAMAFLNARDDLWLSPTSESTDGLWCLLFAVASPAAFFSKGGRRWPAFFVFLIWLALALAIAAASISECLNSHIIFNWLVPVLVQFPGCMLILLIDRHYQKKDTIFTDVPDRSPEVIDVFISVASKQAELARNIRDFLNQHNRPAFFYPEHINFGVNWVAALADAIEKCHTLLFILSEESLGSPWCYREIQASVESGKRIIVLRVDGGQKNKALSFLLPPTQEVDGRNCDLDELVPRLLAALNQQDAGEEMAPRAPS